MLGSHRIRCGQWSVEINTSAFGFRFKYYNIFALYDLSNPPNGMDLRFHSIKSIFCSMQLISKWHVAYMSKLWLLSGVVWETWSLFSVLWNNISSTENLILIPRQTFSKSYTYIDRLIDKWHHEIVMFCHVNSVIIVQFGGYQLICMVNTFGEVCTSGL